MRGSWWTAVQAALGLPLAFAVNLVVARTLGPHGFGLVASYTAVYAIGLIVLNGGVSDATLQWGAAAHARGERSALLDLCRRCAGYHVFVEGPLGALGAVILLHRESVAVQVVGALAVGATMVIGTNTVLLSAMGRNAVLAKVAIAVGLATQLAVVTAAVGSHAAGPTWVARIAVAVLSPIGALALAPSDIRRASLHPLPPHHWPDGFARYAARVLVVTLVQELVFARTELLVLDAYGDVAAAGVFALAAGLAAQITAPVDAMLGPLIPAAAGLVAIDRERASAAVLRGIRLSSLATVPVVALGVPVVAVLVPSVYGGRFALTAALFVSLGAVSCLQSVLHPMIAFVGALRRPLLSLGVNTAALVVDLVLVVALVPALGAVGAVVGNSAGQLVALAAPAFILRRYLQLPVRAAARTLTPFVGVLVWVIVVCVVALLVRHHVNAVALAAVTAVVSLLGVLGVVRTAGGLLTDDDVAAVVSSFPRAAGPLTRIAGLIGMRGSDPA